jgi:pilus assembly protein Flp/PilA
MSEAVRRPDEVALSVEKKMLSRISEYLNRFREDENGASLVEYGLLVALIALAVIATLRTVGTNLNSLFQQVASNLTT